MKTCQLSDGYIGISKCIDISTREEVEMTRDVQLKLIDQMLEAIGYKRIDEQGEEE